VGRLCMDRTSRGGQPWYSLLAILTALTLRAVFHLALRQTGGLIGSLIRLLDLGLPVPDHTTLSRRSETLEERCLPYRWQPENPLICRISRRRYGSERCNRPLLLQHIAPRRV
jgi:hypothetical protein